MGALLESSDKKEGLIIDGTVVSEIPIFQQRPLSVGHHGSSARTTSYRIDTQNDEGKDESYFMKVPIGENSKAAVHGEFDSTSEIHRVVGDFIPKPIAWGSFETIPDTHYYICKFYDLQEELPDKTKFCENIAKLHLKSESPNGKFGYHLVTYNGNLPQDNKYTDTWEEFFTNGFRHMLNMNIDRGGPWEEIESLQSALLNKVIPRLLRPMETEGRSIKPVLVHGDLWCGNTAVDTQTGHPLIFDPASFYAHNEYELGNWRPKRNQFSQSYVEAYHEHIRKTEPVPDYDDRNALYAMRFNMHAAALFPERVDFRDMVIGEAKRLVAKYPTGYDEIVAKNFDEGKKLIAMFAGEGEKDHEAISK